MACDVLIAGGGAVGSACAYFLRSQLHFNGSILVVEPDPGYRTAASTRSASSIRVQFSAPINISLSEFGMQFLRQAPALLQHDAIPAELGLVESSYLYLATAEGSMTLAERAAIQRKSGVAVTLRDREELGSRYPWLNSEDLVLGSDTAEGEGWFDGYALLSALRGANERSGVRYVRDRVVRFERDGGQIRSALLEHEGEIGCRFAVNAAGTRSRKLAESVGIALPVFARKRNVFVFTCPVSIPNCPLVIDPSGLWFRPERDRFLCGPPEDPDPNAAEDDFEVDLDAFERAWPLLAHRVPAFEAVRMSSGWAGHYDYNTFDQNAFVGPVPGLENFLLASGFSGHGLQQAPGIGRALAEYICFGSYRSIDLEPLSYARYAAQRPLRELNII